MKSSTSFRPSQTTIAGVRRPDWACGLALGVVVAAPLLQTVPPAYEGHAIDGGPAMYAESNTWQVRLEKVVLEQSSTDSSGMGIEYVTVFSGVR